MLRYNLIEGHNGSLFVITSAKDNLYGLNFTQKDIEELDFDDEFLQDKVLELDIVKLSKNKSQCIKKVVESCHKIFLDVITGKYSDKIIFLTLQDDSARSCLVENLIAQNGNLGLVHLKIENVIGQTFYFIFNENHTSTMEVIIALKEFFANEYDINLIFE